MLSLSSLHLGQGRLLVPSNPYFQGRTDLNESANRSKLSVPSLSKSAESSKLHSLAGLAPLEAILFDIDGTLCDSDPLHFLAFRELLKGFNFNNGVLITEEFFIEEIAGKHNVELSRLLFPDLPLEEGLKYMDYKEAMFRRLAADKLKPVEGLKKLCKWIEQRGLKRGAVTNAPKENADLIISKLGLSDFFQCVVLANDCARAKPFPDPYLKGLEGIDASPEHTLVFEDSVSGIKAGVAAGLTVLGIATRNPEDLLLEAGATFLIRNYDDRRLWVELDALDRDARSC